MELPRALAVMTPASTGALVSGVFLALSAAPTVTDRDAGELATAAFALDVAHPTGFPFDLVLLRLSALLPVGDVAFRMNLCVAALGALACALLAALAARLADGLPALTRWLCALTPVAVAVSSPTLVRAWTAVEVYASSTALALAALALVESPVDPVSARRRCVAAMGGLALFSLHTSARPAVALVLAVLLWRDRETLSKRLVPALVAGALTLPLVLWIPIAARRDGPVDWGDAESARAVMAHLSASSIRSAYAGRMLVPWRIPEDLARGASIIWDDLGPLTLALSLGGAALAWRSLSTRLVLVVGVVDLVYAVVVNPMGIVDRQTFFHLEVCLALLAVLPCVALARRFMNGRARIAPQVLAAALLTLALLRRDPSYAGGADGWNEPEVLGGAGALGAVPARAIVLSSSDDLSGGALYAQYVEGERPDVAVVPRQHLGLAWTWRRLDRAGLRGVLVGSSVFERSAFLLDHFRERVRWEGTTDGDDRAFRSRWRFGSSETPVLAAPLAPVGPVDADAASWLRARMPSRPGSGARNVNAAVLFAAASRVASVRLADAVPMWRATIAINPAHVSSYTNLGVAAARAGDLRGAVVLTRAALALDPERPNAWRNLSDYLGALGDAGGAREARRESVRRRSP